jgi:hypothetical protein
MMTEEKKFERIETYLKGNMSRDEKQSFENELTSDDNLQKELVAHRKANSAIAYMNRRELKHKLESIDAENPPRRGEARIRKLVIQLAVAASVVLLAGFYFMFGDDYFAQQSSLAVLSEEYFVPTQQEIFKGNDAQNKHSYEEQLIGADQLYQNGQYEEAIIEYKRLSLVGHTLNDLAEWNLAMSYLLSESHQSDFDALLGQIIADSTHPYNERAIRLRKELR